MNNNWTKLWLTYTKRKSLDHSGYIKEVLFSGFSEESNIIKSAYTELKNGIRSMLDIEISKKNEQTFTKGLKICKSPIGESLCDGAYILKEENAVLYLYASSERGVLYGIFHMLRQIAMEQSFTAMNETCIPENPYRILNHWDNMDGSIERGYSGNSFFFEDNKIVINERTIDYARMAASVSINCVVINNVNVKDEATNLITPAHFGPLKEMMDIFSRYGIKLYLSLNYAAPMELSGLDTADPLSEEVGAWWQAKMAEVYKELPDLGGFLVKADSEGRPGPFTYNRTQAEGANMLAKAIEPYGGIIIWRCFVYNCTQDWRDYKTDRARAAYDNFMDLDGAFADNVILQIKNGPMDFQIREPISPLLGGMEHTNQILEVQIAQEYTGQQIDVCYLIPLFKEVLDFKTYCGKEKDTVADIISGRTFQNKNTGIAAVCNTGNDENWTGNDLAAANLYGFGRLAFCTSLTAEEIAQEWIRMTFSNENIVVDTVKEILLNSRETYEKYTCPLGIGWMVNPHLHYGPSVDGYEYSRWGTYHRADHLGIGVDRTDKGTGYAKQYRKENAMMYNKIESCPEELLLFFHHVPYTHVLKNQKTLIQHIYDDHFEGVLKVEEMIKKWEKLEEMISTRAYQTVRQRFYRQLDNAKEWRDQVNSYFYRKSGIKDLKNRTIF
ncbi:alpha-glucuronidase [Lachnospiraceae bacterium OttesenSCG-928-D06]|nr:alpha-glucuronidase [Lachnospiraceae bacterium OttesenSCG-928-D06]